MLVRHGVGGGEYSVGRQLRHRSSRGALRAHGPCQTEPLEARFLLSNAVYNWQSVNIPAGGFVDGIFYDPRNRNVIYARTDVGGLYKSVNDGGYWTQLLNWVGGNTSGSGNGTQFQEFGVLSFAIDPENSNNLYAMVGEYSWANGDVLYSTDAGATWNTTPLTFWVGGNSNGRGAGERIAVDPYDSSIVFIGSNANGLWKSTNAGHSFSQVTSVSTSASINFVVFDPNVGTVGNATQEIFVGENSTASGTNLLETTNGGTSWTAVTGTGTAPTGWLPNRAAMASDGNLYLAYANDQSPTEPDNGGVFRYNTSTGVWANISPVVPQVTNGPYDYFGYCGLCLDPSSPTTLVVTSLDRYNFDDNIWRTTNANASAPSWVALYATNGYNGYNTTRNTTSAPYTASGGDGIGNWANDVAINPFNPAQIMHTCGGGIWATNFGASGTTLTNPNSWYFPDTGIGMTAILGLTAANGGTPLYSGMGDVGGFAFTNLAFSPTQGNVYPGGNGTSVDSAGLAPLDAALVGNMGATEGFYSTNGTTFTAFAANPGGSGNYSNGTVAESANGASIVWAPSNEGPYYSKNNGASWSPSNLIASVGSLNQVGGVPTVVTTAANNFAVGQSVTINGASPSVYDGAYTIASIVNSNTFTYNDSNVTSSTSTPATGAITASLNGTVLSDKVNPNYFYFWTENSSDNSWTFYISSDEGITFNPSAGGPVATGNATVTVNPNQAGQIWLSSYVGLYESTNFGASFNHVGSYSNGINSLAIGAPAPGQTLPAIYIYGTPAGDTFQGIYRSDDGGNTWLLLNDVNHQWGGTGPLAADPNIFGRVYAGAGGIIMGNPSTSLPANWSDADINEPGNPGWATSSINLSTGTTVNQWNLAGGGAGFSSAPISISSLSRTNGVATAITNTASGLQVGQTITIAGATNSVYDGTFTVTGLYNTVAGLNNGIGAATEFTFAIATGTDTASGTITATLADQFNFAYQPLTGSNAISAKINAFTNADAGGGTPQVGVMYRAAANPTDPFFAVAQTSAANLLLEYRSTSGGAITTQTVTGIPVGSEYVKVIRNGSNFSGYYSANGTSWTQIGSTVPIAAMPTTADVGLMGTASFNPQLTGATFSNVVVTTGPSIATAAAATPNPVTGTSTTLTVLGSDAGGQSSLAYSWSYNGPTGVSYSGSTNGTNAAKNITANFTQAGTYTFTVTITDTSGLTTTSQINVTVAQTPTAISVSPSSLTLPIGFGQQYSASVTDQFGNTIASPTFIWTISGSANSISTGGNATLGSTPGSYTVTATDGSAQGTATLVAENFAVPNGSTLNVMLGAAGAVALSQGGGNLIASQNGVQISFTGITSIAVTDSGSADVLNFNGPVVQPFSFASTGSSFINVNAGTLTFAASTGGSVAIGTLMIAAGASAIITPTTSSATTLSLQALALASGGALDLTNNKVLINYGTGADPITALVAQIAAGFQGGAWNASGIISSSARTMRTTALGIADASDPGNPAGLAAGTLEIKYTYYGDANLSGAVDSADYTRIDNGFLNHATGWQNGDFNYDGIVNGSDYTLIDNAFNTQGASLAAEFSPASAAGPSRPHLFASNPLCIPTLFEMNDPEKLRKFASWKRITHAVLDGLTE